MRIHYTEQYLLTPQHKVTVNLVGLGGTGSQVLTALARMNEALRRYLSETEQPITERTLRQVLRQEIPEYLRRASVRGARTPR